MQKAELQIIFHLLQDKECANKTIREIAAIAGVSVGSVHSTLAALTERGFLIDNGRARLVRKRATLIDRWALSYAETLKQKLLISRFTFLSPVVKNNWQDIILPPSCTWGGEPAAALQDGYLLPERWDIYVEENANALIATGRMIPNPQGEIFVYKRFWHAEKTPLLVVYADLLATEDDRCIEAAERIKPLL